MGLLPNQPNMEFWNTELYGGPKQYDDFPIDGKHTFAMCNLLFNQKSRGSVTLKSADPSDNPVVDHNYLADPLDMLVMTEACRFANEMVMNGKGTKNVIKGSWPADLTHHKFTTREDWEPHVRKHATTCKLFRPNISDYSRPPRWYANKARLPPQQYMRNGPRWR